METTSLLCCGCAFPLSPCRGEGGVAQMVTFYHWGLKIFYKEMCPRIHVPDSRMFPLPCLCFAVLCIPSHWVTVIYKATTWLIRYFVTHWVNKSFRGCYFVPRKIRPEAVGSVKQLQPWKVVWICHWLQWHQNWGLHGRKQLLSPFPSSLVSEIAGQTCHLIFLFTVCTESFSPST